MSEHDEKELADIFTEYLKQFLKNHPDAKTEGTYYNGFMTGYDVCAERKDKRIAKLTDKLFALGAMDEPPCFNCGYSGEGYFSPDKHTCASKHNGDNE